MKVLRPIVPNWPGPGMRTSGICEIGSRARLGLNDNRPSFWMRAPGTKFGRTFDLPAGTLLTLDQNLPHDVEALEESAFLLTIAWPG